jgi:hypothetical protein
MESAHIVRSGPHLDTDAAAYIRQALEARYPSRGPGAMLCKLIPLSMGAWLLLVRIAGQTEADTFCCERSELAADRILERVDVLVNRLLRKSSADEQTLSFR